MCIKIIEMDAKEGALLIKDMLKKSADTLKEKTNNNWIKNNE